MYPTTNPTASHPNHPRWGLNPGRGDTIAFRADPEARPAFTTLEAPATDDGGDAALYFR